MKHYGPYGPHCMYMGQLDAGECYLCYARRKDKTHPEKAALARRLATAEKNKRRQRND